MYKKTFLSITLYVIIINITRLDYWSLKMYIHQAWDNCTVINNILIMYKMSYFT